MGVLVISSIITWLFKRTHSKKMIQKSGNNSTNIQVGENINIKSKEHEDE
jgi:hypothetical protein